jgi:hypothetical protein
VVNSDGTPPTDGPSGQKRSVPHTPLMQRYAPRKPSTGRALF